MVNGKAPRVVVMGASNRPWAIDDAILRRLSRKFFVGPPTVEERESILRKTLHEEPVDRSVNLRRLAQMTDGFTGKEGVRTLILLTLGKGSDLKELCKAAALAPVLEFYRSQKERASRPKQDREFEEYLLRAQTARETKTETKRGIFSRFPFPFAGGKSDTNTLSTNSVALGPRPISQRDFEKALQDRVVTPSLDRNSDGFMAFAFNER